MSDDLQPAAQPWAQPQLSDAEVVRRVLDGETALFEILMRRYNQRLFRIARTVLRDEAEAEDVTQEAYVRAYTSLHQFQGEARFSTWLTKIALHEALARRRKTTRWQGLDKVAELDSTMPVHGAPLRNPEESASDGELRGVLTRAIEALPESYRLPFVLRDVEGMSTGETAQSLEISPGSVRVRLHRARARIRQEIDRRIGALGNGVYTFLGQRCDRMVAAVLQRIENFGGTGR